MRGLLNIYQHHSNYQGIRVKIPCAGHTYMLGGNGAGKTTTLNLIPIFYGKDPTSLVARTASKSSFVDHYLPNYQSMVVFEYERSSGETCCVVMYRRDAGQYAYRFVKGAADDTLFAARMEPFYENATPASEILKYELPKFGIDVSNQILNTIDYRSIIQGDPMSSGKRRHRRSAAFSKQREMREYSLGDVGDKMQHIESLTAIAFNNNKMLANLKAMIVDTMVYDYTAISQPRAHHKSDDLWNDLSGLQAFAKDGEKLREGLHAHADLKELRHQIVVHQSLVKSLVGKAETQIRHDESAADQLRETIESESQAHQERLTKLNGDIAHHRGEHTTLEQWLENLEADRERWEAREVEEKKQLANSRPAVEIRRREAIDKLKALTAQASSIEEEFKQLKEDARDASRHEKARLQGEQNKVNEQALAAERQQGERQQEFFHECRRAIEALTQESQAAAASLQGAIDELYQSLDKASQTQPDEAESLARSQEVIDSAQAEKAQQDTLCQQAGVALGEARQQHDDAMQAVHEADRDYARLEQDAQHLADRLNPGDSTLLAFLRESGLPWHDTIGKAVSPGLLMRNDLSPAIADKAGTSQVFGVSLDLSSLERPEVAQDEAVLQSRLEKTEADLRRAKTRLEQRQEAAKKKHQAYKDADDAAAMARRKAEQKASMLKDMEANHRDTVAAIERAKSERRATVQSQLSDAKTQKRQREDMDARALSNLKASHGRQEQQLRADHGAEIQRLTEQKEHLAQQVAQCDVMLEGKLRELDALLHQALTEKGVDTQAIRAIKEDQSAAEEALDQIRQNAPLIHEYDEWRQYTWGKKAEQERALSQTEQALQRLTREKSQAEAAFATKIGQLRRDRDTAERSIISRKKRIQHWEALIAQAGGCLRDIPVDLGTQPAASDNQPTPRGNDEQIETQLRSFVHSAQAKMEEVISTVRRCQGVLSRHPNSMVYRAWEELSNHRRNTSQHPEGSPAHNVEMMRDIERLLDHDVPGIEAALIENVHATGAELNDYFEALGSMSRAVDRASRRLHSRLNTENAFDAITDLSVTIRSRLHRLGFWKELMAFHSAWSEWVAAGASELPGEILLDRIRRLQKGMQQDRMDGSDIHSLVDMEVEFYEQSRRVPIRTDADLENASSKGISRLAILVLFSSLTRYLCPNEDINLTWPIDELGELEMANIQRLFDMMEKRNISLFCAEPKYSPHIQHLFDNRITAHKDEGVRSMVSEQAASANNLLLALLSSDGDSTDALEAIQEPNRVPQMEVSDQ